MCRCMAQILLVASNRRPFPIRRFVNLTTNAGHEVIVATGFSDAIELLTRHSPDLLITELRLGAFNGLHLIIRHRPNPSDIRAIVIDRVYDNAVAAEAERYGATYVAQPINAAELVALVAQKLAESRSRRWRRKQPETVLLARIAQQSVRVLDVSYGGLRLESACRGSLSARLHIIFPGGVTIDAKPVWSHPAPSGTWWCGAEVLEPGPAAGAGWRQLVDSIRATPQSHGNTAS